MFIVERQRLGRGKWHWIVIALGMLYCFGFGALLTMHVHYTPSAKKKGSGSRHEPLVERGSAAAQIAAQD
jgi:hypothetical protein